MASKLINQLKEEALSGRVMKREDMITLLSLDPDSPECQEIGQTAREVAGSATGNKAYLWAAIGIDYRACPMDCHYCSLGEAWGLVEEESELTEEEIFAKVENYARENVQWIVLRTTQFYSFEKLIALAKKIKKKISGSYKLVANTGEFNEEIAKKLIDAGFEGIYHTLRLREGIDTQFDPNDRLKTLEAIKNSSLKLISLVEPLGVEHSNEEIADSFYTAIKYGAIITGVMARVPVNGTPLGKYPAMSKRRLAQIIAVIRLAAGRQAPDICVHPASEVAIAWGANVAVVETGSIPRETSCNIKNEWQGFDPETAKKWFEASGYTVIAKKGIK